MRRLCPPGGFLAVRHFRMSGTTQRGDIMAVTHEADLLSLPAAKVLELTDDGSDVAGCAAFVGSDVVGVQDVLSWARKHGVLRGRLVGWPKLLGLVETGELGADVDAMSVIRARAQGHYWDPG